jgi:ABC-type branched-subunit amino acid transport system ATPase component
MITKFTANSYGCLRSVELGLTPIHALIGPNDSGKSTLLRAMRTLSQFAGGVFYSRKGFPDAPWSELNRPFELWPPEPAPGRIGSLWLQAETPQGAYALSGTPGDLTESFRQVPTYGSTQAGRKPTEPSTYQTNDKFNPVLHALGPARLLRLDPDALREPTPILVNGQSLDFQNERGAGLASVLHAINNRDAERFVELQGRARTYFPGLKTLQLHFEESRTSGQGSSSTQVSLRVRLDDGTELDARRVSEGLLYFLAFSALEFLERTPLLLLEEPENGLHPARIGQVMKALRDFHAATGTQIVLATHSPLVVNELEPEEVTVVTRPSLAEGTVVTPIAQTADFAKRSSVFDLGELWIAFANGVNEEELLTGESGHEGDDTVAVESEVGG